MEKKRLVISILTIVLVLVAVSGFAFFAANAIIETDQAPIAIKLQNAKQGSLVLYKNDGYLKIVKSADENTIWYRDEEYPGGRPIKEEASKVQDVIMVGTNYWQFLIVKKLPFQ